MFKFFNCCLLTALFFMLHLSLPLNTEIDTVIADANDTFSATDNLNAYKITSSMNMNEYNSAYYCGILGGNITIELNDTPFTTYLLSVDYIILNVDNTEIHLKPNTLYALSCFIEGNSTWILANGIQHKLLRRSITVNFISYGVFGNINIVNQTTYHDKVLTAPIDNVHSIASGTANIIKDTIYFYPKPLTEYSDTLSQFIIIDNANRLVYYTLTNQYCIEINEEINSATYTVDNNYIISNIDSPNSDSPAEITANNIRFHTSGKYRITLIKDFYKTVLNIAVLLPIDIDPIPPEPDLPPDGETPDEVEPPVPPDNGEDLPPNTDDKTDADNLPAEEILPPSGETTDSEVLPDFNINYERHVDYVKVIIVAVCVAFAIGGTVTISIILSQIKKRQKKINK